jgi:hypothetical protein
MTMDEIAQAVSTKTGLSMDQSKQAVQAMLDFVMSKMSPEMGEMVKNMMMGNMGDMSSMMGNMGDMNKMMGDMGNMMGDKGKM